MFFVQQTQFCIYNIYLLLVYLNFVFSILSYQLDGESNQKYKNLLESTLRTDYMYVTINGTIINDELSVFDFVEAGKNFS